MSMATVWEASFKVTTPGRTMWDEKTKSSVPAFFRQTVRGLEFDTAAQAERKARAVLKKHFPLARVRLTRVREQRARARR